MDTITYEARDSGVAVITLNRPDVLNSMNPQLLDDVRAAIRMARDDNKVGAVLLTGAGRGFCAGADLAAGFKAPDASTVGDGVAHGMEIGFNPMVREIAELPKPVVFAVNGIAAGGGVGLALAGDVVFAAKSASFVQVFGPKLALVPDCGVTYFMPRLIGMARTRALAMSGDKLSAEQAADWGLIWACVDDDKLMDEAMAYAEKLASGPTEAFGDIKAVLDASLDNDLAAQLDLEKETQRRRGNHPNFAEGVSAFLQKRAPNFVR